jgi:hypothetical protein
MARQARCITPNVGMAEPDISWTEKLHQTLQHKLCQTARQENMLACSSNEVGCGEYLAGLQKAESTSALPTLLSTLERIDTLKLWTAQYHPQFD